MRRRSHQSPAARDLNHFQLVAAKRDDPDVTESVFTSTETKVDHGSTIVSDQLVTTKVTISDSKSTDSSTSTSTSAKSSSTSDHSTTTTTSSSSQSTSSTKSSSSDSTSTSAHSTSSGSSSTTSATSTGTAFSSTHLTSTSASSSASAPNASSSSSSTLAGASAKPKVLSTGAIIGIAAGGGALVLLLLIFIIRKRCLRRKERRLDQWLEPALPSTSPSAVTLEKAVPPSESMSPPTISRAPSSVYPASVRRDMVSPPAPMPARQYIPPSQALGPRPSQRMQPQMYNPSPPPMAYAQPPVPYQRTPPPMTYNSYTPPPVAPAPVPAPGAYPEALRPAHRQTTSSEGSVSFALVRAAFVPSLADELAVNAGEMVRVLAEYDDGWALCANLRGEQGVVPQECLQRRRPADQRRDDQLAFMSPNTGAQNNSNNQAGGNQYAPQTQGAGYR
ncbi:hypothetical protein IEO21_03151 [Rhodonia placenta]|uniref:SH3 domain-containing protein n=1 Tax=Rhodonia placenta TaxID=104341 RepID=A0A8H7U486_9APHY|nr:hypothetical protein IEO21_03151 [Postia placenta]